MEAWWGCSRPSLHQAYHQVAYRYSVIYNCASDLVIIIAAGMHIITRKRLNEFATKHPDTTTALQHWYRLIKDRSFNSFAELRLIFPSADRVDNLTVFNIGGNKVRLIAAIHYNRQKVYIRAVLTHDEYDRGNWKE